MSGPETLHATAVSAAGPCGAAALLILGGSGAGKSMLAIELIALGANLISDDLVTLSVKGPRAQAAAPPTARPAIEARGVGLLPTPLAPAAPVGLVVDLDQEEETRLPPARLWRWRGASAPLLHRPPGLRPAALLLALRAGGPLDPDRDLARWRHEEDSSTRDESESLRRR